MKQNKLKSLPPEDQRMIFDLCSKYTYEQVADLLAKPRPEGLALQTSASALCRFNSQYNPSQIGLEVVLQVARALEIKRFASSDSLHIGILTLVEKEILKELSSGAKTVDLLPAFRVMNSLQKGLINMDQWRETYGAQKDVMVHEFVRLCRDAEAQPDCEPITETDPVIPPGEDATESSDADDSDAQTDAAVETEEKSGPENSTSNASETPDIPHIASKNRAANSSAVPFPIPPPGFPDLSGVDEFKVIASMINALKIAGEKHQAAEQNEEVPPTPEDAEPARGDRVANGRPSAMFTTGEPAMNEHLSDSAQIVPNGLYSESATP